MSHEGAAIPGPVAAFSSSQHGSTEWVINVNKFKQKLKDHIGYVMYFGILLGCAYYLFASSGCVMPQVDDQEIPTDQGDGRPWCLDTDEGVFENRTGPYLCDDSLGGGWRLISYRTEQGGLLFDDGPWCTSHGDCSARVSFNELCYEGEYLISSPDAYYVILPDDDALVAISTRGAYSTLADDCEQNPCHTYVNGPRVVDSNFIDVGARMRSVEARGGGLEVVFDDGSGISLNRTGALRSWAAAGGGVRTFTGPGGIYYRCARVTP